LIYIEYISRRPGVSLEEFHRSALQGQEGWDSTHSEDRLVWNAARTWRLGPEPEYISAWHTPAKSFARIDDWDRIFRSGDADAFESSFFEVARIEAAGCYEPLREPVDARGATYYAEFLRMGAPTQVLEFYEGRAARHPELTLNLLLGRVGRMGPDPGGLAVWTIPDFASLAGIAPELDDVDQPVTLVSAGTYTDVGREIL
jgi:hypothetical protein